LIIWKIDRLGRNLRDLIDIVTTLQTRGVGVRSLTNGIVDTTTTHDSSSSACSPSWPSTKPPSLSKNAPKPACSPLGLAGRVGGRKPKMTPALINKAQRMYNARQFTMAEIAQSCDVTPITIYRHITTGENAHHS